MSNDTTKEYAFSLSDDGVHYWHKNIEDAIEDMRAYDEDCRTLYMGEVRQFTHGDVRVSIILCNQIFYFSSFTLSS